mgnify:CR=1 FL=1
MNNRDHRKITVIDGKVGFTGGYNLADEYFNITHPYGEWKDTGLKLTGDAVRTLTMLFLSMWNSIKKTDEPQDDYIKYIKASDYDTRLLIIISMLSLTLTVRLITTGSLKMFILILLREPSIIFTLQHHICLLQKRCPESLQWQQ